MNDLVGVTPGPEKLTEAPYYSDPGPLYFFQEWPLPVVPKGCIRRIQIRILEIHRDAVQGKDEGSDWMTVHVKWSSRTYNVIAEELYSLGRLTEDFITNQIPRMVFDACMTAYWFRYFPGSPLKTDPNQIRFGHFWIYPESLDWQFLNYLKADISIWLQRIVECPFPARRLRSKSARQAAVTTDCSDIGQSAEPVTEGLASLAKHRRAILKDFMTKHDLEGVDGLCRRIGICRTALYGMTKGDKIRYSDDKLDSVLRQISCRRARWDRAKHPTTPV